MFGFFYTPIRNGESVNIPKFGDMMILVNTLDLKQFQANEHQNQDLSGR